MLVFSIDMHQDKVGFVPSQKINGTRAGCKCQAVFFKHGGSGDFMPSLSSPVPDIRWRKVLEPMPSTAEISTSGAVLKIFNIQLEDEGIYECEAENIRGKDKHQAKIYVHGRYFSFLRSPSMSYSKTFPYLKNYHRVIILNCVTYIIWFR